MFPEDSVYRPIDYYCDDCDLRFEKLTDVPRGEGVLGHVESCPKCGQECDSVISATPGWVPGADRTRRQLRSRSLDHAVRTAQGKEPEPGGRTGIASRRKKLEGKGGFVPPKT